MPAFVVPAGTAGGANATVVGLSENLVYDVGGITETLTADIVKGSLTLAPSANNTCLVNDTDAAGQSDTRLWGEQNPFATKKEITIDTIGSEISTLDGKLAAFKIGSELFLAEVDTTNNVLKNAQRGWFLDSANAPIKREVFNNNDTITLMKAAWLFLDSDGTTVDVTYNEPAVSATAPTSPQTGDYWSDIGSSLMKRYSGVSFDTVTRTYVGIVVMDSTDCIGARANDFDARFKDLNTLELEILSSEKIRASSPGAKISVYGKEVSFGTDKAEWNITTQLAAASENNQATEQASTYYGVYLADDGEAFISDMEPHSRPDLAGLYHPFNPWRFVGEFLNSSGSDISMVEDEASNIYDIHLHTGNGYGGSSSGETNIRNHSVVVSERGTSIARIVRTTTTADSYKLRRDGDYYGFLSDFRTSFSTYTAFSFDSVELSTPVQSVTAPESVIGVGASAAGVSVGVSFGGFFQAGTVVRIHTSGDADSTTTRASLKLSKGR